MITGVSGNVTLLRELKHVGKYYMYINESKLITLGFVLIDKNEFVIINKYLNQKQTRSPLLIRPPWKR
jgi:hypothetical protein